MGLRDEFIVGRLYRIAKGTENPVLRGQVVTYLGYYPNIGTSLLGGPPHLVRLVESDGSLGEKYLVRQSIICRL